VAKKAISERRSLDGQEENRLFVSTLKGERGKGGQGYGEATSFT